MPNTIHRLVGQALLQRRDVPVLILEGPRGVGKTTLARSFLEPEGYSYTTLADRSTLRFAAEDPEGWVRRPPRPAVIDEAQLLPELPLVLKELIDALPQENHFILTGSASIGGTGLGGADPLARRASRLTMSPLTSWELAPLGGSVVDLLFDADIRPVNLPEIADADLAADFAYGGFPQYALASARMSRSRLRERVASDTLSTLATGVLPDMAVNPAIALEVLDALVRVPGGIFNASRLGQLLGTDKRTVDRYMGVFGRLFLLHWLPNLATAPANQTHARAKVHPVDTSLAVEALERAGADVLANRELFGQLLESHVVNQILAARSWADLPTTAHYWRQAGAPVHEVDLVLEGYGGRRVGIEVKAAARVNPADLKGLRALRDRKGLDRGFLIYTGTEVRELDPAMWALPVSALRTAEWAA
ncbi:MAG: DUF4143 domain-containing protein [Bifidobacteriaceae bacterium]|nr:DUF4143 domain-containing protein [Bifidobacteriaceae bacterium]